VGGTALELGDRFNLPNGKIVSGASLQVLAAESILQNRMLRFASDLVTWVGPCLVALLMLALWRRQSALARAALLCGSAIAGEAIAVGVQSKLPVIVDTSLLHLSIAAYLAAIALDELDLRALLSRIAERRFQRITMSLGDGVVCADDSGIITAWNPAATQIFGYHAAEMVGQPFARILAEPAAGRTPFSLGDIPAEKLRAAGGTVIELDGRRKNGEFFALEACVSGWGGHEGGQYGAILRDISVRKREAERIRYLAEHDTLTGLANRNALTAHLYARISEAQCTPIEIALLAISVDKFQLINDMHGHDFGEDLLRAVAERLGSLVSSPDLLARIGGDEFAVVVCGINAIDRAVDLAFRMCSLGSDPVAVGMREQSIRLTVGIAAYPTDCVTADELLGNAHLALHRAKAVKRGGYLVFERGIRVELESRLVLEAELARAAELNEFELFYQPQVTLQNSRLIGAEALIRWRHPVRGLLAPAEFMPIVNTSSISDRIAFWVMQTACMQARQWQRQGYDLPIAINLSPSQLRSDDIVGVLTALLAETGCPPHLIELEVTEDILVEDESAVEIFRRLRALGVRILLDDFGTGYASLSYLKKFPLDGLKIDRSFVRELQADSDDAAIVGSIIELGKRLGLAVLAEGIEDRATNDLLLRMGCNKGQGYYFGRPAPPTEFEQKFLRERGSCRTTDASELRPTATRTFCARSRFAD
jgi:diguanylate cyclase (GGDEF)-like protein/PAS domain S-box-containing protein